MKEKEYKEEIIRLENVLLEKEKTIQDLQDEIHLLNLQKYKKYNLINIQKDYFKNPNNEAIYDTLIHILNNCVIYNKPLSKWNNEEHEKMNQIAKKLINRLEEERNLNND